MALTSRDWWMLGIGAGVTLLIATSVGRRAVMSLMGLGKAEVERALSKVEAKAEERRHLPEKIKEKPLFS